MNLGRIKMIIWQTKLHFICDKDFLIFEPLCEKELILDQTDAKTKKGMFAIAKKIGWVLKNDNCYCPSCAKKI